MKCFRNRAILLSIFCFLLVVHGLNLHTIGERKQVAVAARGRYTAQEVLFLAERINALLSPKGAQYNYVADYREAPRPGRTRYRRWSVLCTNQSGTCDCFFTWNADTGELDTVSCGNPPSPHPGKNLSALEAVDTAAMWMRRLGWATSQERVRLVEGPRKAITTWLVGVQAGQRKVQIIIHDGDGGLFRAQAVKVTR